MAFQSDRSPFSQMRWVEFTNTSAEIVPANAVVQVAGSSFANSRLLIQGSKPTDPIDMARIGVNSHQPVPVGGHGRLTYMSPVVVAKSIADGIALVGTTWGPSNNDWQLRSNKVGFTSLGGDNAGKAVFSRKAGTATVTGAQLARAYQQIPARVNQVTPGRQDVRPCFYNDVNGQFEEEGTDLEVLSWVNSPSRDPTDQELAPFYYIYVWIEQDDNGVWFWTGEDCPPVDPGQPIQFGQDAFQIPDNANTVIIQPP